MKQNIKTIPTHERMNPQWTTQYNNIRTWLLLCTCGAHKCHCNATFKLDILCIIGHPYNHPHQKGLHHNSQYFSQNVHTAMTNSHINSRQDNIKISTANQQHHNKRMELSPTHGLSYKHKSHHTYPINEKSGNKT